LLALASLCYPPKPAHAQRTPAQAEEEVLQLYEQALKLEAAHEDDAARPFILRALDVVERKLGLQHPGLPILLSNATELGKRLDTRGDYTVAEQLYRRALALAGAEAQLMSLWQVSDAATRDLMTDFYRRLLAGASRADACVKSNSVCSAHARNAIRARAAV
jgi:tetratricopeptide (TPR) repeat protein